MPPRVAPGFVHLNAGGTWPGFSWTGLELHPDGALRLFTLPWLEGRRADLSALPSGPSFCTRRLPESTA